MSASTATAPASTAATAGPRRTLVVLRVLAALHAVCIIVQPMLAGMYLDGDVDALDLHEINASVVSLLGLLQLIAAIAYVWKGRGRAWPLWASLGLVLAEQVQAALGYADLVAIHIPLGVSVVAMQILLTVWLFRSTARERRS